MPPTGFKRSRALWDNARRPRENRKDKWISVARAILYELQPIRVSEINTHMWTNRIGNFFQQIKIFVLQTLPCLLIGFIKWILSLSKRQWFIGFGIVAYYLFVRFLHNLLHAGPVVLIVTALVAIFTIGLDDKGDGEISAYSVFNRGFQRMLGSVDSDALLAQHVGGGAMMAAGGMVGGMGMGMGGNNNDWDDDDDDHDGRRRVVRANNPRPPAAAAAAAANNNNNNNDEQFDDTDDDDDDDDDQQQDQMNRNNGNNGGARRSGKKARRRNLEQRREIRRQRDAAAAMGFNDDGDDAIAMQRLIEGQIQAQQQ